MKLTNITQLCFGRRASWLVAVGLLGVSSLVAQSEQEGAPQMLDEVSAFDGEDPDMVLQTVPLEGALGFAKSLVETPRSVSVVSSDLIDKIGIRDGDQLSRIVPGTYTVNRWGIAGATNVRGLPADTYLRGMKRIDAQGNIRNVITMWENVEVVRGPPMPIFGNGRIGGYVNYTPKSVRGTTGRYQEEATGSVTLVGGSYERMEAQVNYASPINLGDREAGFQVFGLINDSDSFFRENFQRDRVIQTSAAVNLTDTWRLETGAIYQRAINAGQAGANRVTQETFDNGTYLRGTALFNLDTDFNGTVSEREIQASRGLTGFTGARPLSVNLGRVMPQRDTMLARGDSIIGVPQTYIDILTNPNALPNQIWRDQAAAVAATPEGQALINAGPIRYASGAPNDALTNSLNGMPGGFLLDPTTLSYVPRDWSRVAIEEKADGHTHTGYLDFLNDYDPSSIQKLQIFYDHQAQQKASQLPFNQDQDITVFETKATVIQNADSISFLQDIMPDWLAGQFLGSANVRYTDAQRQATSGDYDQRRDLVAGKTPTDTFTSFLIAGDTSAETGEPFSQNLRSKYIEMGIGLMADFTFFERLGFTAGIRADYIDVTTTDGERFLRFGTQSANILSPDPAVRAAAFTQRAEATNNDWGISKSVSVNYELPYGITPYLTVAESSTALTGTFQDIAIANVRNGAIIGKAELKEIGVKGNLMNDKLFYAFSLYEQTRAGNVQQEGESYNRSTFNKGFEAELRYVPNRNWAFIFSATYSEIFRTGLDPAAARNALVTAEYLGVQDIVAPGVSIDANSLLYGGNTFVALPNSDDRFLRWGQYPDWVLGSFIGYTTDFGVSLSWSANWVSSVSASSEIPDILIIPSSLTHNVTIAYDKDLWRLALQVRNVGDEERFAPNTGSFGAQLLQATPPRSYEISVTRRF